MILPSKILHFKHIRNSYIYYIAITCGLSNFCDKIFVDYLHSAWNNLNFQLVHHFRCSCDKEQAQTDYSEGEKEYLICKQQGTTRLCSYVAG